MRMQRIRQHSVFNKVPHHRLIDNLEDLRIDEELGLWILDQPRDRKQNDLVIKGKTSEWDSRY